MHDPELLFSVPLAYMGLGLGLELIPYFLALLGFVAAASLAVLQWPFFVLLRWWRKGKPSGEAPAEATDRPAGPPSAGRENDET